MLRSMRGFFLVSNLFLFISACGTPQGRSVEMRLYRPQILVEDQKEKVTGCILRVTDGIVCCPDDACWKEQISTHLDDWDALLRSHQEGWTRAAVCM